MNENSTHYPEISGEAWLLLIFQLPAKPAYLRVKIWRRLQSVGAVAIKNSVYALPANEGTQEDYQWLLREIQEGGGEGMICEARLVDGLSDAQVRQLFDQARDADYEAVLIEARSLINMIGSSDVESSAEQVRNQVVRLRKRLVDIHAVDFFGASGRESAEGLISALEIQLKREERSVESKEPSTIASGVPLNSVWVTRTGVHVDRIASAWLIRQFIDPGMQLKFVPAKGYVPEPGELRFDMFEAEYTHEGDNCTFEVLLARAGLHEPALHAIAEIIHDIDIKDGKFGREETAGVKTLIAGICFSTAIDEERIARGASVFEDLYEYFKRAGASLE